MKHALEYETFTGAALVKKNEIIYMEMTSIEKDHNPLAHAELKVIQSAIAKNEKDLESYQLFTTQKPCVMCASAIVWAGIKEIYFGINSNHHWKSDKEIFDFFSQFDVKCVGSVLEEECREIDQFLIDHGI